MPAMRVSWKAYHRHIASIGEAVKKSGFKPNVIVAISRGGLPVGLMLSEYLKKPLAVVSVQSYDGQKHIKMKVDLRISSVHPVKGNILLVDDLVDSGKTMKVIKLRLEKRGCVRTAVMFKKKCSVFDPDFFAKETPAGQWIFFPYDFSNFRKGAL